MKTSTNQLTANTLYLCQLHGCKVSRNNTMGVFDTNIALEKIHALKSIRFFPFLEDFIKQNKGLKTALQKSYRESHEMLGRCDIEGMTMYGRFLGIEIKGDGDEISLAQASVLLDIYRKGGVCCVVVNDIAKVKYPKVFGFNKIPIVQYSEEAMKLFLTEANERK